MPMQTHAPNSGGVGWGMVGKEGSNKSTRARTVHVNVFSESVRENYNQLSWLAFSNFCYYIT